MIAVSFARGASDRKTIAATRWFSTYIASPHNVRALTIMSRCASELCAKKTGYKAVQLIVAKATGPLATCLESLHSPSNANAVTSSIEIRVTAGVKPLNFHQNANHNIISGGCALDRVV